MAEYTIDSVQDLIDFTLLTGKFYGILWKDNIFNLTTDLDIKDADPLGDGSGWLPIGDNNKVYFNGFFNGQGHVISNMTINRSANFQGFFGSIDPVSGNGIDTFTNAAATNEGGSVKITEASKFDRTRVGMEVSVSWHDATYADGWYDVIDVDSNENYIVIDLAYVGDIASGITGSVGRGDSSLTDNPIKNLGLEDINITGGSTIGGMIGSCLGFNIIAGFPVKNCYVTGSIIGTRQAGGFIGGSNNGYFLNCYTDVGITINSIDGRCGVGSFVGSDYINTDCVNCYGIGLITHNGDIRDKTFIGGLCGEVDYDIVDHTNDGVVTEGAGGKVLITKAGIFDEAAVGMHAGIDWNDVNYTNGWFEILASDDNDTVLIDVDFNGNIASGVDVDICDPSGIDYATNSFWDKTTTGVDVDGRGDGDATGKTTAQMKKEATFTNWDFSTPIWWITEDSSYPQLQVFGKNPGLPSQATNPSPIDNATDVAVDTMLSWIKDSGDNVLVYFDKKSEHNPPTTKVIDDSDEIIYDPPVDLAVDTVYVWRVDTKNENGTTTGDQWEFTTIGGELAIPRLVKGDLLNSEQGKSKLVNDIDLTGYICPSEEDCNKDCKLMNVPNAFHPGTIDTIIDFSND